MGLSITKVEASLVVKALVTYQEFMTPAEMKVYQQLLLKIKRSHETKRVRPKVEHPSRNSKLLRRAKTHKDTTPEYWEQVAKDALVQAEKMREAKVIDQTKSILKDRGVSSRSETDRKNALERARTRRAKDPSATDPALFDEEAAKRRASLAHEVEEEDED